MGTIKQKQPVAYFRMVALIFGFSLAVTATAQAYIGQWTISGRGENVVAADCGDCDEDIGMMLVCKGAFNPAQLLIPAAANELGIDGRQIQITIVLDGEVFLREAMTEEQGLIGFVPVLNIALDDPVLQLLQSSSKVTVTNADMIGEVALKGSRAAITKFMRECGWT